MIRDDAAVGLLRLTLVGDLDLHAERVALEHRRGHAQLASEVRHARAMNEAGLHDQPLGQRERQGPGRHAPLEQRLAGDIFHVHEERLGEATEVDERHDVGLRNRSAERPEGSADLVLLKIQSRADHGCRARSKTMSQTSERGE
jgi:hypothetical protein